MNFLKATISSALTLWHQKVAVAEATQMTRVFYAAVPTEEMFVTDAAPTNCLQHRDPQLP